MNIRALVLGAASIWLAIGANCRSASADCVSAQLANPYERHYTLAVENHCKSPIVLSVCWRWPGGAQSTNYRLSLAGKVTFLGPEVLEGGAASAIWLRCRTGACKIACAPSSASRNTPAPAPTPPPVVPPVGSQNQSTPSKWGAIAAGIDTAAAGGTGHVGVGWAVGDSEIAAQQAALAQCKNQGISSCKIVDIYNEGCGYVTTGNNGRGDYGWGTGATPDRAMRTCASQGLACQKPIGGCVK